jgi:hypothetical protein
VFFVEIRGNDETYLRALQMAELPGARCRLLLDQQFPVTYDDQTGPPPKVILIGVDGMLLYAGSFQRPTDLKRLLKQEIGKVEKGWGEDPLARKARALAWGQWKLGEAHALLEPALAGSASPEVTTLAGEIEKRFEALVRAVSVHAEQGEPARVALAMSRLELAAVGKPAWSERVTRETVDLGTTGLREGELELELDQLLKPTLKDKPKKGLDEKLRAFATGKAAGTKVGARAARLADAVARTMSTL